MSESAWQNAHLQGGSVLRLTDTKETAAVSRPHSRVHRKNKELRA